MKAEINEFIYSDKRKAEFTRLIKHKKPLIYSLIYKFDFVRESDVDDYYQEAILYAWKRFYLFDSTRSSFTTWLYKTAEWGILLFRRMQVKNHTYMISIDPTLSWFESIEDVKYNEEHLEALRVAIADLPAEKQKVVQMYLNDEDLTDLSIKEGRRPDYYKGALHKIRKFILRHHGRYFEDIFIDPRKTLVVHNGKTNELNATSRPIEMRTLDGQFIKTFPSLAEAGRHGFDCSSICDCANGRINAHKGYKFWYVGETRPEIINRIKKVKKGKPIAKLDPNGTIIKVYETLKEIEEEGLDKSRIYRCISGQAKMYRGFLWQSAEGMTA